MYLKEFEIRWSDIDANRHLGNTAYINFMSHTRMSFFMDNGFSTKDMAAHGLGPVVFYEHIYYFREVLPGQKVKVSLEFTGMSEEGTFFEFHHNFYDSGGNHVAHCEMMGGWISLEHRKLVPLKEDLLQRFNAVERSEAFRVLTRADTRKHSKKPKALG